MNPTVLISVAPLIVHFFVATAVCGSTVYTEASLPNSVIGNQI